MKKTLFTLCAALLMLAATAQDKSEAIAAHRDGVAAVEAGNTTEAIAFFEQAVSLAEEVGDEAADVRQDAGNAIIALRKQIAQSLFRERSFEDALKTMEQARDDAVRFRNTQEQNVINRALPTLYLAMGNRDIELELYDEAVELFRKGIELNPNMARLYFGLGVGYQRSGNLEEALTAFDRTMEVAMRTNQPEDVNNARTAAKNLLLRNGQEAKDANNWQLALEYFSNAVKYDENDPDVRLQIAIAANNVGNAREAIAAGEKALELERRPSMIANIHFQLGYAHELNSNTARACEFYRRIPAGDSNRAGAEGAIRRLGCR